MDRKDIEDKARTVTLAAGYLAWALKELLPSVKQSDAEYIGNYQALHGAYLDSVRESHKASVEVGVQVGGKSYGKTFIREQAVVELTHCLEQIESKLYEVAGMRYGESTIPPNEERMGLMLGLVDHIEGLRKEANRGAREWENAAVQRGKWLRDIEVRIHQLLGRSAPPATGLVHMVETQKAMDNIFGLLYDLSRKGQDKVNDIAKAFNRVEGQIMGVRDPDDDHTPMRDLSDHAQRAEDMIFVLTRRKWIQPPYEGTSSDLQRRDRAANKQPSNPD